ncbi:MAG: 30S ribosomal protein S9 [Chloroflexi bacterium]|nr:30S ribosomal protein S9 [Chloroflexota bacterium]MCI0846715.1 30S ribosomal protein S9 [Chloroflexota bacterium]
MVQVETQQEYFYGTGKRKRSIARVRLYLDEGAPVLVNNKPMEEYFGWKPWQQILAEPFEATETVGRFRVVVRVLGGGVHSQAEAIRHGISRALVVYDQSLKPALRQRGFITRDARIKESKKYGLKRARRAPQYTKR